VIRLDDQVAIITGSGRGLGAAYAHLLAERGARVVIHDAGVNKDGTGFNPKWRLMLQAGFEKQVELGSRAT
jgi:NAD(P)-dependent dehydrogenase (short-subunit alcohol dehydrogenase family)